MSDKATEKAALKQNTKVLQSKRRRRRQWLTFLRMIRYGVNNFTRNAWLTIAATAVMTVTLVSIFMTVAAQDILKHAVDTISNNVSMSIYLKPDVTQGQVTPIMKKLEKLSSVRSVSFLDSDQARQKAVEDNKSNTSYLRAIAESTNQLPATISVKVDNLNNTEELDKFVRTDPDLQKYINTTIPPSYLGKKREIIQTIGQWTSTAQKIGWAASIVFVVISSLIIFNTIRMAIFSRKEEIQMMKLIGADKQFIRGPFIVEAIVYGFIGAVLATAAGYGILLLAQQKLGGVIDMQPTIDSVTIYLGFVILGMVFLGALIGTASSLLATRRYLKI